MVHVCIVIERVEEESMNGNYLLLVIIVRDYISNNCT